MFLVLVALLVVVIGGILWLQRAPALAKVFARASTLAAGPDYSLFYWRNDGNGQSRYSNTTDNYAQLFIPPNTSTGGCNAGNACADFKDTCDEASQECFTYSNAEIYNNAGSPSEIRKWCQQPANREKAGQIAALLQPLLGHRNSQRFVGGSGNTLNQNWIMDRLCELVLLAVESHKCSAGQFKNLDCRLPEGSPCVLQLNPPDVFAPSALDFLRNIFVNVPYRFGRCRIQVTPYGLSQPGSFGFGFWSGANQAFFQETIVWFVNYAGPKSLLQGFYIQLQKSGPGVGTPKLVPLPALEENRRYSFEIEWMPDRIRFWQDGVIIHEETEVIPDGQAAFHCWIDNSSFGIDPSTGNFTHHSYPVVTERGLKIAALSVTTAKEE